MKQEARLWAVEHIAPPKERPRPKACDGIVNSNALPVNGCALDLVHAKTLPETVAKCHSDSARLVLTLDPAFYGSGVGLAVPQAGALCQQPAFKARKVRF